MSPKLNPVFLKKRPDPLAKNLPKLGKNTGVCNGQFIYIEFLLSGDGILGTAIGCQDWFPTK